MASGLLPKSPVSSSLCDEGPSHIYSKIASRAQRIFDQQCQKTFATQSANSGHRDKLFWTSVVIPTTCRCHHSACAVSGAVMPVPCGLTTVYPLIDRTCSRVKPWPELPSCTNQLLPPTWLFSTNT